MFRCLGRIPAALDRTLDLVEQSAQVEPRQLCSRLLHKFRVRGQLCFGKVSLDKVVGWTPVEKVPGMNAETTSVSFSYTIKDVPSWARSVDVRDAIPYVQGVLTASEKHRAFVTDLTLMGEYWSVDQLRSPA